MPLLPPLALPALAISLTLAALPAAAMNSAQAPPPDGAAVLELFTSEGCSSCPPADRLLADVAAEAARAGRPVFALSFHVDYWNSLGWADPFSRPDFTDRQKNYAAVLGGGVYTPELIVNGTEAMAGSDAVRARRAVDIALRRPAGARFRYLTAKAPEGAQGGNIQVTLAVSGAPDDGRVNLALVQPDTAVRVGRGENGGRTLAHHNVVRAFATVRPAADGTARASLPLSPGADPGVLEVIAYSQDPGSLRISGAIDTKITKISGTR